ncbi:MAG TPA: cupredoxin domain-containing protein [Edaphobacter sp.]|nr:cupredoxin domain-containing protein [Edaphobacter sp.]
MKRKFCLLTPILGALAVSAFSVPQVHAQAAPQRIAITAKRFSYDPGEITLKKGQPVVLVLKSADIAHGLRFRDLNVNVKIKAGGTAEVWLTPDKAGDFVGHCSVFCGSRHGSMSLKLHVVD